MASSLFQSQNSPMNNPIQLISEFKKFMSSGITPEKAEQIIMQKINNGEITKEQFEQAKAKAQQLQNMFSLFQ